MTTGKKVGTVASSNTPPRFAPCFLPWLQAKKRKAGAGVTEAERGAPASQDEDSDEEGVEQAALD